MEDMATSAFTTKSHNMRLKNIRKFVPSDLGSPELESRIALSAAHGVHSAIAAHVAPMSNSISASSTHSSRPVIDTTIALVQAVPPTKQNAINFTSHTYNQIVYGGGGWNGLQQIFNRYNHGGSISQLTGDLTKLSQHVPYGKSTLLPVWSSSVTTYVNSGTVADATNGGPFVGKNAVLANQLRIDLVNYLNAGIGTSFNVFLSKPSYNTDADLTYNGKV